MDYIRPSYIEKLPEIVQEYFKEEYFKDRPYPVTLEQANEYFLHTVCKVDTKKEIKILQYSKNKSKNTNHFVFKRDNYYDLFRYKYWSKLSFKTKMTVLYWFYEDVCKELKIYKPTFKIFNELPENAAGAYFPADHSFVLRIDDLVEKGGNKEGVTKTSAYQELEKIAHELKHAQYFSTNKKSYFKVQNLHKYYQMPDNFDPEMDDDYEKFDFTFGKMMYMFQPTEAEAYNYGIRKAREIFDISNTSIGENGKKVALEDTSVVDLMMFRNEFFERKVNLNFFNNVMKDDFKEYLDMFNLLTDFSTEMMKYMLIIDELDPLATNDCDIIFLSAGAPAEAKVNLIKYNEARDCFDKVLEEMEERKIKMFKKYKDFVVNEKISCYNENFNN